LRAQETRYDAADSNEDGTVSIEERMVYQAEQAAKRPIATPGGEDVALDKLLSQLTKTYGAESTQESAVSVTA
jgi:hypothetical protein